MSTGINIAKQIKVLDEGSLLTPDVSQIDFTGTGVTASAVGNNVTVNIAGASGVWGISNASGVYTYYATLTLAMAAATAGQTIELFADVTESGAVTVTLKDGVTIQGNGHSYNHTQAGSANTFNTGTAGGTFRIFNININRSNNTGGYVIYTNATAGSTTQLFYLDGTWITLNSSSGGGVIFTANSTGILRKFYNANVVINTVGIIGASTNTFDGSLWIYNFNVRATANSGTLGFAMTFYNTFIESDSSPSSGGLISYSSFTGCTFIARGNTPCIQSECSGTNSYFFCAASYTTYVNMYSFTNCIFASSGSTAMYSDTANVFRNCIFISSVGIGAFSATGTANLVNCSALSGGAAAVYNCNMQNCTVESSYNNAAGHAYRAASNNLKLENNVFKVANASANCINAALAYTIKYAGSTFEGSTTPVNANITQGITNTQDNQGNILI
jgi:hypothetical protein